MFGLGHSVKAKRVLYAKEWFVVHGISLLESQAGDLITGYCIMSIFDVFVV